MATEYPLEGDEVRLTEDYLSLTGKYADFTRGKGYRVLKGGLGNGSVALEDDRGAVRNINLRYIERVADSPEKGDIKFSDFDLQRVDVDFDQIFP